MLCVPNRTFSWSTYFLKEDTCGDGFLGVAVLDGILWPATSPRHMRRVIEPMVRGQLLDMSGASGGMRS